MINIGNKTTVYIESIYGRCGSTKSLHELAECLLQYGIDAKIVYVDKKNGTSLAPLYENMKVNVANEICDDEGNILIAPEVCINNIAQYKKIKKVIWWLSWNFYYNKRLDGAAKVGLRNKKLPEKLYVFVEIYWLLKQPKWYFGKKNRSRVEKKQLRQTFHMYNCIYTKKQLLRQGISPQNMRYLCGPLENTYLSIDKDEVIGKKENIVTYNPAKTDLAFLEKVKTEVLKNDCSIKFIAIENMTRTEVFDTLSRSKVYVDFGYFPGQERMPREAVILYANIITSKTGAAGNYTDVPIPEEFKFELKDSEVEKVSDLILKMIGNYDDYMEYFDIHRKKALNQIKYFSDVVKNIFEIK